MIDDMTAFIFKAVNIGIFRIICKADSVVKFSVVHLMDLHLFRMGTEQIKDFLHRTVMLLQQSDQLFDKLIFFHLLMHILHALFRDMKAEPLSLIGHFHLSQSLLCILRKPVQLFQHPGHISLYLKEMVQGTERIIKPYLFLSVAKLCLLLLYHIHNTLLKS